jgi:hypothetical protein
VCPGDDGSVDSSSLETYLHSRDLTYPFGHDHIVPVDLNAAQGVPADTYACRETVCSYQIYYVLI